jgi:acyl-coenzyme A thioesterase PaaI-like protein
VFQYSAGVTSEQPTSDADPADRLGAALRSLADNVVRAGADAAELDEVAAVVEHLRDRLGSAPERQWVHDSPYHPMSLVGGTAHPVAPQLHTSPSGGGVAGTVTLGPMYEGGPGLAHGGVLSLLFDHAMGQALFVAGYAAMTVSLEVRYRAPTPLHVPLAVSARLERVDGRKLFVSGQVAVAGDVTAEASAVFVRLTRANVASIFPPTRLPGS